MPPGWKAVAPAIESGQSFVYPVRRVGEGDGPPTHALKRLKNPSRTSRFVREVTTMRRLREDFNIAVPPVVEEDLSEKKPWFAMPWYRDGSLEAAMYTGERWPNLTDRLVLARHVARVLASLHDAGYAHRDLKPANVLLHGDDVVLADFGLCLDLDDLVERLTATSEAIGSRFYIAPENEEGMQEQVDQRPADFYAFGKTLWAMVVRARPLPRETILEPANTCEAQLRDPRLRPLDFLLRDLVNRDPRLRLQSWPEVLNELDALVTRLSPQQDSESARPADGAVVDSAIRAAERIRQSPSLAKAYESLEESQRTNAWLVELWQAMRASAEKVDLVLAPIADELHDIASFNVSGGSPPQPDQLAQSGLTVSGAPRPGAHDAIILIVNSHRGLPSMLALLVRLWVTQADDSSVMLHRVLMASPGSLPERVVSFVPALVASCGPLPIHRQSTIDAAKAFTDETVELWIGTVFRYLDIVAAEADPASDISWEH